jgi:Fungal chitosanase of glycosyl hydrolase group 75
MLKIRPALILLIAACAAPLTAAAQPYQPPPASRDLLRNIDFSRAAPVDEAYRAEFKNCDDRNVFRGRTMTGVRKCSGDKNNVRALLKLENGAILYESKMGLDLDGSWKAWNTPGSTDLRGTSYQWPRTCAQSERDNQGLCQREQVDSEHIPYIVIPIAGPTPALRTEFRDKTGVDKGDFGVIIFRDAWVPAFVADGGPFNKLGEASAAALAGINQDRCTRHNAQGFCDRFTNSSIGQGVITIIFPGSRRAGMTPENVMQFACAAARDKLNLTGSPRCPP